MDYKRIIWLASYPKSGNTWTRCFLDAYFLGDVDLNEIVTSVSDDVAGLYQLGDGSDITKEPINIQQMARPMAMARLVRMHDASRGDSLPLFVKTHQPHLISNGIELLPEGLTKAVINIVRDPRDVLPSFSKHMGQDLDSGLEWMQDRYRTLKAVSGRVGELISSWDNHVNSFLSADTHNVLTIKYEDMLSDPIKEFAKILKHSGIEPDMYKVEKAVNAVDIARLREKEQKEGFTESSPHAKNQFFGEGGKSSRKQLEHKHLFKIDKQFGRIMKRLNYIDKRRAA